MVDLIAQKIFKSFALNVMPKSTGAEKVSAGTKRKPRQRARRSSTGELEPMWAGYRRQQELMAQTMTTEEIAKAQRRALLLTTIGLPASWTQGPLKSDLGPLFDEH